VWVTAGCGCRGKLACVAKVVGSRYGLGCEASVCGKLLYRIIRECAAQAKRGLYSAGRSGFSGGLRRGRVSYRNRHYTRPHANMIQAVRLRLPVQHSTAPLLTILLEVLVSTLCA